MRLKSRLISAAAVAAMAAAAMFGSTFKMDMTAEGGLSLFDNKETIYFWYSDESMSDYIQSAAVAFGERENVRVIPVLGAESEYLEEINNATLHSEQQPDAYMLSNDSLEKAYLAGLACEIEDEAGVCTEQYFSRAALDAVAYKDKTIAYPLYFETSALVYNKTYLNEWEQQLIERQETAEMTAEEAAADAEEAEEETEELSGEGKMTYVYPEGGIPRTIDQLLTVADTFDVPEGVEAIMKWDVSDILYNYWIVGNYMDVGGDAGDNAGELDIDNAETIQCLEVYKALNQFFYIESDTVTYESVIQDFIDGRVVFTIATTDVADRLRQAKEAGELVYEYGIAPMPEVSDSLKSRSLSVTNAVVINGYSGHRELANRFAAFLTAEYAGELYERAGRMPACVQVGTEDACLQAFADEYAESVPLPKMMETGNFWMQLEILFSKVWNGEDVQQLVEELAEGMRLQLGHQG